MGYKIVDATSLTAAPGPHPAASPHDKDVSSHLGLRAFEVYQVELPPGERSVQHDHSGDGAEDVYAVIRGAGKVVVDGVEVPVRPGMFIAVAVGSTRYVHAGDAGLIYIAICGYPRQAALH